MMNKTTESMIYSAVSKAVKSMSVQQMKNLTTDAYMEVRESSAR